MTNEVSLFLFVYCLRNYLFSFKGLRKELYKSKSRFRNRDITITFILSSLQNLNLTKLNAKNLYNLINRLNWIERIFYLFQIQIFFK